MKEIIQFQSLDGQIFSTRQECQRRDATITLERWLYDKTTLTSHDNDLDLVAETIVDNFETIQKIISGEEPQ